MPGDSIHSATLVEGQQLLSQALIALHLAKQNFLETMVLQYLLGLV